MRKDGCALHPLWSVGVGEGALFTTALHSGHDIRHELHSILLLTESCQLREEDPFTDELARISHNYIIPLRSRFEVDLNRKREEAVYLTPDDAWGLNVWLKQPTEVVIQRSLKEFDLFYAKLRQLLNRLESKYKRFIVFDLHSYNHRRNGPDGPPEDPRKNPDINIGTGTMERPRWASLVDHFIHDLRAYDYQGGHLDVRENVKFKGRQFATFVHTNFPASG